MARMKQKARLSTGGKAPRKQIGMLAARKTKQETTRRTCLLITFVGLGDGQELWVVQWRYTTGGEFKWLRVQRVKELFGLEVYNWCRCRRGGNSRCRNCSSLGLNRSNPSRGEEWHDGGE